MNKIKPLLDVQIRDSFNSIVATLSCWQGLCQARGGSGDSPETILLNSVLFYFLCCSCLTIWGDFSVLSGPACGSWPAGPSLLFISLLFPIFWELETPSNTGSGISLESVTGRWTWGGLLWWLVRATKELSWPDRCHSCLLPDCWDFVCLIDFCVDEVLCRII